MNIVSQLPDDWAKRIVEEDPEYNEALQVELRRLKRGRIKTYAIQFLASVLGDELDGQVYIRALSSWETEHSTNSFCFWDKILPAEVQCKETT